MDRVPVDVTWEVSRTCFLRCVHCSAMPIHPRSLDAPTGRYHISGYLHDNPIRTLELSGGEPLLGVGQREWWRKEALGMIQRGSVERVVIQTSGIGSGGDLHQPDLHPTAIIFDESWCGLVLQFSVHSVHHGTFDAIVGRPGTYHQMRQSLMSALESGIDVEANVVPMAGNFGGLEETVNNLVRRGVRRVNILRLMSHGYAGDVGTALLPPQQHGEALARVRYIANQHPDKVRISRAFTGECGAGRDKLYIDDKGDVYPCVALRHSGPNLGYYYQKSLAEFLREAAKMGKCEGVCCTDVQG